jgi:hypothetical protein
MNDPYSIVYNQEVENTKQNIKNSRQLLREKITNLINYLSEQLPDKAESFKRNE